MEQFHAMSDSNLYSVAEKVYAGERLNAQDGITLFNSPDLFTIARLAHFVREKKNGKKTYFIQNGHINPTNICVNSCRFCAFKRKEGDSDAYRMSINEVLRHAKEQYHPGLQEYHLVAGLDKQLNLAYYEELFSALHEAYPQVHIQALTAVEIAFLADDAGLGYEEVLERLKKCGLGSLPGGGAEIFNTELRRKICPEKITAEEWLNVMDSAHRVGLKSNATMLYGHIETVEHRVEHLLMLREQQDKSGGFLTFIPLAFHPENTEFDAMSRTSAVLDLKTLAVSRLLLDNFPHIKAFWIMISLPLAQLSQFYGVDDIDGTVLEERITHSAGAETEQGVPKSLLKKLIREPGFIPVERDTLYHPVESSEKEASL